MKKYLIVPFLAFIVPSIALASFNNNLYYGMTGNADVTQLQTILTSHGLYSGPITGNFFGLTQAAVESFQTENNLPSTGYVGPLTREVLNNLNTSTISSSGESSKNTTPTSSGFVSPTTAQFSVKTQVLQGIYETVSQPVNFVSSNQGTPQPDAGDKYVSTYVSFDNESQNPFSYSIDYFTVVDPTGASYNESVANFYPNNPPDLNYGTANPSSLASGVVIFEVPATLSATSLIVHSESDDQAGNEAVVDFKYGGASPSTISGNTTSASTATTCSTGYGYNCSPTTTSQPTTAVQSSAVITPTVPTTLTDQEYAQQITENVTPFMSTTISDIQSAGSLLLAIGNTEDIADLNQAQTDIDQAQSGMQALQGEVPSNMTTVNTLLNESISSYSEGIGLALTAFANKNISDVLLAESDINQGVLDLNQVDSDMTQLNTASQYQ